MVLSACLAPSFTRFVDTTPETAQQLYERLRPRLIADPDLRVLVDMSEVSARNSAYAVVVTVDAKQWDSASLDRRRYVMEAMGRHLREVFYAVQPEQPRPSFTAMVRNDAGKFIGYVMVGGVNDRGVLVRM
jgi:hypothetical protein